MSAGRTASAFLITIVSTLVLFLVFWAIGNLPVLAKHSYATDYGWQTVQTTQQTTAAQGICDRPLTTKGFPLSTRRPAPAAVDPTGCQDQSNPMAGYMNLALYFAAAALISTAIGAAVKQL
jgi:hypothetical protein